MSVNIKICVGRFGNQLFPYFLGRIISENLKFKLFGPTKFTSGFELKHINLVYDQDGYSIYNLPVQQLGNFSLSPAFSNPDFNIQDIITDKTPRYISLDGYFQRKKFYTPFKNDIIQWFGFKKIDVPDDQIALHLRLGDLTIPSLTKNLLPLDYYINALEGIDAKNVIICTDSPNYEPYIKPLSQKFKISFYNGNEKDTISFLASHNNLVLSQGTFSFWAAFFSQGNNIINALPKTGWNSEQEKNNIDLLLQGPQYKYIAL